MSRRAEKSREPVAASSFGGDDAHLSSPGAGFPGEAVAGATVPTELALVARELRLLLEALGQAREGLSGREAALAVREQALHERESTIAERERILNQAVQQVAQREATATGSAGDLGKRAAALDALQRELQQREKSLQQRADEVAILEAAAEEAMALASEAMEVQEETRVSAPRGAGARAGSRQLAGPAEDDAFLLEGPDAVAPPIRSAASARPVVSDAMAEAAREAEILARATKLAEDRRRADEEKRRIEEDRRRAEEAQKLADEGQTLVALIKSIPMLAQVGERVQRVLQTENLNQTALFAFYSMCISQLREDILHRMRAVARNEAEAAQQVADAEARNEIMKEDFNRYRNRVKTEQDAFSARATEELLRKLVPVADNFTRALAVASVNTDAFREGVRMIHRQLGDVLTDAGLVPIKCEGDRFDPQVHEALMRVETDEFPEDTVCEEVQRGYHLAGKLFRPALVKVARAPVNRARRVVPTPSTGQVSPEPVPSAQQSSASPVAEAVQESQVP